MTGQTGLPVITWSTKIYLLGESHNPFTKRAYRNGSSRVPITASPRRSRRAGRPTPLARPTPVNPRDQQAASGQPHPWERANQWMSTRGHRRPHVTESVTKKRLSSTANGIGGPQPIDPGHRVSGTRRRSVIIGLQSWLRLTGTCGLKPLSSCVLLATVSSHLAFAAGQLAYICAPAGSIEKCTTSVGSQSSRSPLR